MQMTFTRSFDSLRAIYDFTEDVLAASEIEDEVRFPVHLAMEELFTNMVKYCPDNDNEILVDVTASEGSVSVAITDYDVDPFDVTAPRDVDPETPLGRRVPGGLGLHLVQQMVSSLEYDYHDRQSTVRFTKRSG
jgi:serine/threonine-protein kinase RsbW/sigma-B regulation protein RsbU (phosphoserine phosphatase)